MSPNYVPHFVSLIHLFTKKKGKSPKIPKSETNNSAETWVLLLFNWRLLLRSTIQSFETQTEDFKTVEEPKPQTAEFFFS